MRKDIIFAATIGSIGLALSGYFIGSNIYKMKALDRYVTVKGLAETMVEADYVSWEIPFLVRDSKLDIAYKKFEQSVETLKDFFDQNKIAEADFKFSAPSVQIHSNQNKPAEYEISGTVRIGSQKIDEIQNAEQELKNVIDKGVTLGNGYGPGSGPKYYYTKLDSIRPEITAKATESARRVAEQFADDSGAEVGNIRVAHQGRFQILPEFGESYQETNFRKKKVRLVSTIDYYLK